MLVLLILQVMHHLTAVTLVLTVLNPIEYVCGGHVGGVTQ